MISVWPKFYPKTDNYQELAGEGPPLSAATSRPAQRDWVGPGYLNTYLRSLLGRGARDLLAADQRPARRRSGIDAWWMDATEPDMHSNLSVEERAGAMRPTALGPGRGFFNTYPAGPRRGRRTRAWHGSSRTCGRSSSPARASAACSGRPRRSGRATSPARWDDLARPDFGRRQFLDVGHPQLDPRYRRLRDRGALPRAGSGRMLDEWRELNLRWFQFGAFSPLFRSHGEIIRARDLRARRRDGLADATGRWPTTTGSATG